MAEKFDIEITDTSTPWEGYVKARIEEFIKKRLNELDGKVGVVKVSDQDSAGYYSIISAKSLEDYNTWRAGDKTDPEIASLVTIEQIPISAEQGDVTIVSLERGEGQKANVMALDGVVKLSLKATSVRYNPATKVTSDTGETVTLVVQAKSNPNQPWTDLVTIPAVRTDRVETIDLSNLLNAEVNYQIRVQATGNESGKQSVCLNFGSVLKTNVTLTLATDTGVAQNPINGLQIAFRHTGAVARTLHLEVYDCTGEQKRVYTEDLGTLPSGDAPKIITVTDSVADLFNVANAGVHKIKAWLSVNAEGLTTPEIEAQIILTGANKPLVALNSIAKNAINWSECVGAKYTVWLPQGMTSVALRFVMTNASGSQTYFERTVTADNGATGTIMLTPEVDGVMADVIATHFKVYAGEEQIYFGTVEIDNYGDMSPTSGVSFILDPRTKDNATNPTEVLNAVTKTSADAVWSSMTFASNSGWVEDKDGVKCLHIPQGSSVRLDGLMPFAPFTTGAGVVNPAMTLELDIKVSGISDATQPVISAVKTVTSGVNTINVGFALNGVTGQVLTTAETDAPNQDIALAEGVRRHVAINVIPNLRNEGLNYVRIFIDGIISREFTYSKPSNFAEVADVALTIGGKGADITVYGLRYHTKGLTEAEVRKDFVASKSSVAEKKAIVEANDILDGAGNVSYDKCFGKVNTLLWEGERETKYGDNKKTAFTGAVTIDLVGQPEHSGKITNVTCKGQGTSSMTYYKWNQAFNLADDSVWTDGNGVAHTDGYRLRDNAPAATKLVGKINFASSPQSHKMGSCELYDALWKRIIQTDGFAPNADGSERRVAVAQEPVMFFVKGTGDSAPRFAGLMTFGAGKGDEPTFGFGVNNTLCIEGADNDKDLLMHRVPWTDDEVTLDGKDWIYKGEKQLSIVGGKATETNISKFKGAFNFVYSHYLDIAPFAGTSAQMQITVGLDKTKQYWISSAGDEQYSLWRWCPLTTKWVKAGVAKTGGEWGAVVLSTEGADAATLQDAVALNAWFKAQRAKAFKEGLHNHFDVNELLFTMSFCHLIAASDNRGKNTYLYLRGDGKIGFMQDDLDTIFATNNTGQLMKPYWVEVNDKNERGEGYWNSTSNALYNATEIAFESEYKAMMGNLLNGLRAISGAEAIDAFDKLYFDKVKQAFCATAYNATAMLRYEAAATAMKNGAYTNGTNPLTQSLGSQIDAEREWMSKRIKYLASWAQWGEFSAADGVGSAGVMSFRSIVKTDGTAPSYKPTIKVAQAMYPSFALGATKTRGTADGKAKRMMEGESATFNIGTSDGNTNIFICGVDSISNLGDFTSMSLGGALTISSDKLEEFSVDGVVNTCEFRPTGLTLRAPMLKKLSLRGASTIGGALDLSGCAHLKEVDLRGTSLTALTLPEGGSLVSVKLPETLTSLIMYNVGAPSLAVTIDGGSSLTSIDLRGVASNAQNIILNAIAGNAMTSVKIGEVNITGASLALVRSLAASEAIISGKIAIDKYQNVNYPTGADKAIWMQKWGDVDDPNNSLYITYQKIVLTSIKVSGSIQALKQGTYEFKVDMSPATANDIKSVQWSIVNAGGGQASIKSASGDKAQISSGTIVTYASIDDVPANPPRVTVTCTVAKTDGTSVVSSAEMALYVRPPQPGDKVYSDGTYSSILDPDKSLVGVCFWVDPDDPNTVGKRLAMSTESLGQMIWGMYYTEYLELSTGRYLAKDVQGLPNIGDNGGVSKISEANYRNGATADGFAIFSPSQAPGRLGWKPLERAFDATFGRIEDGTLLPYGQWDTIQIIRHRDFILSGLDKPIPSKDNSTGLSILAHLKNLIYEVRQSGSQYEQLYYPAASHCYHYEPTIKAGTTLAEYFTAGHWWLPSAGELLRYAWYYKFTTVFDDVKHILSQNNGYGCWSSTEQYGGYEWFVVPTTAELGGNFAGNGNYVARPVTAF